MESDKWFIRCLTPAAGGSRGLVPGMCSENTCLVEEPSPKTQPKPSNPVAAQEEGASVSLSATLD